MVLLDDGFPGRLKADRVIVHPMDGRYLLEALLAEQDERPRRRLHAAIARTAHAIVGRAEPLGDALVIPYVDTASSMAGGSRHISGLPQAYYAVGLSRAAQMLGDESLQAAGDRFFRALLIPVSDGGALYPDGGGPALAQVPTRPRDLILNGWLSMLVSVHRYAQLRDSEPARELFAANLPTLRRLLPLYDVPQLRLSRYGLTGPLQLRLEMSMPGVRITDLRVALPGEGDVRLLLSDGGRWTPRIHAQDVARRSETRGRETVTIAGEVVHVTTVLTRAGYPEPNHLRMRIASRAGLRLRTSAHIGRYDPAASSTVEREWVQLRSTRVAPGSHAVEIELPYRPIELFAYPTHFTPGPDGGRVNAYHGTHIVRLRELADITGDPEFSAWAERWAGYVGEWPDRPELEGGTCWTPEGEL